MTTSQILTNVLQAVRHGGDLPWVPYTANGRTGTDIVQLYDDRGPDNDGPAAALVRYHPGTRTRRHLHPGYELIFVLDGVLHNDGGKHEAGTLEICPPNSTHELWSDTGCVFLVVWEKPVQVLKQTLVDELQTA